MRTREVAQLPPQFAVDVLVGLFAMLGPVEAVSLWTTASPTRIACLAGGGSAPQTRRLRAAARSVLSATRSRHPGSRRRGQRWDMPFAALVARTHPEGAEDISPPARARSVSLTVLRAGHALRAQLGARAVARVGRRTSPRPARLRPPRRAVAGARRVRSRPPVSRASR